MKSLVASDRRMVASNGMLTGDQIAAARQLGGFKTQKAFAKASGVPQPTLSRAELAGAAFPKLACEAMAAIIQACEVAGVEFILPPGASLAGGLLIGKRSSAEKPGA